MFRSSLTRASPWLLLALLAACAPLPPRVPTGPSLARDQSRWVAVSWDALPGWTDDRTLQAWPALLRSCERPPAGWTAVCDQARRVSPRDDRQARAWLMQRLRPYRVESLQGDANGLAT